MAYTYKNPYQQPLLAARQELNQRRQELGSIQERISQLESTIQALTPLAEYDESAEITSIGLPMLCLQALDRLPNPEAGARPLEIRDSLVNRGIDLSNYSNQMAIIHTTLTRLLKEGDVELLRGIFALGRPGALKITAQGRKRVAQLLRTGQAVNIEDMFGNIVAAFLFGRDRRHATPR